MNGYLWRFVQSSNNALNWNLVLVNTTINTTETQVISSYDDNTALTLNGGTLSMDVAGVHNNAIQLTSSSQSRINSTLGSSTTIANVLADATTNGAVGFSGVGTTILTAANTYTGVTTVDSGATLQVGDGGTSGSMGSGAVTNNGTIVFNRADSATVANDISGTGALTQSGAGTLTLTGANSYSGLTTVDAGKTLQVGAGGTGGSLGSSAVANSGALIFNRSDALTVSGVISGAGSLTQAGTGTTTLTGANTFGGATTISNGTLQIGGGGASGSLGSAAVTNNGTLAFNRSDTVTIANDVSGSGALTQAGSGTTILTGANTYGGVTTISNGTLQIGAGGASGSLGQDAIIDNANLAFNRSDSVTLSNAISGTGALTQAGPGTLILTGVNTYTGATTINNGTLQVGAGGFTGAIGSGAVVNNGSLVFNRADNVTVSGAISGAGSLTQLGIGTLTLTGANSYSGLTTVDAGKTLQVGAGGTGGSLGSSAVATIGGAATLEGVLNITAAPGTYKSGVYRLLTAGSVSGSFSGLSTNLSSYARLYTLSYQPNAVDLTLVLGPDAANTRTAVNASKTALGGAMSQRMAMLAGALDYDCPAFNEYGVCLSFQARYGAMETWNDGAGVLIGAGRLSPQVRFGGFIDQAAAAKRNGVAGVKIESQRPAFGGFIGFNQFADGRGAQMKLSAAYRADEAAITRDRSLPDTEAGSGKARLDGFAVGAELGYGVAFGDALITTPYVGMRHTQASRAAYQEAAVPGAVDYAISYEAFRQRLGAATAGLRLAGRLGERVGYRLDIGVDYHFFADLGAFAGVSEIYGLEAFSLPGAATVRRVNANGSAGIFYEIDRMQALTANVALRAMPFSSQPALNAMTGYRAAF